MSTAYYYFAASLPMLAFDTTSVYSLERFLEDCQRLMSDRDYAEVLSALDENGPRARCPVTRQWKDFLRALRNQGVVARAGNLKKDPQSFIRGERVIDAGIVDAVTRAGKADNLLAGERILDELKWQRIEQIMNGHFFDLEFLIGYALKLQLTDRFEKMDSVKGAQVFEEYQAAAREVR